MGSRAYFGDLIGEGKDKARSAEQNESKGPLQLDRNMSMMARNAMNMQMQGNIARDNALEVQQQAARNNNSFTETTTTVESNADMEMG